jgi:hypothetical protein
MTCKPARAAIVALIFAPLLTIAAVENGKAQLPENCNVVADAEGSITPKWCWAQMLTWITSCLQCRTDQCNMAYWLGQFLNYSPPYIPCDPTLAPNLGQYKDFARIEDLHALTIYDTRALP